MQDPSRRSAVATSGWKRWVRDLNSALAGNDRAGANAAVRKLLKKNAPLGARWKEVSEVMRGMGELTLAHSAIDAFVVAEGNSPQARYAKVILHSQSGRMREAHELLTRLPDDVPDPAVHAFALGNIAKTLGQMDEAREHLETAVKHRPGWGSAWLPLATTANLATDELGDRLLADGNAAARYAPGDYAQYLYALGKLHADRGENEAAFAAFAKAGELLGNITPYNPAENAENAQDAKTGFADGFLEKLGGQKKRDTSRPIFVTGLPRSGKTIVEHVLASHSEVKDGAELNIIQHLAVATGGVSGNHIRNYLDGGGTPDAMAQLYLHLLAERSGKTGRIVDSSINVTRCMGLVTSYLPDAALVWMRRDPLDCAWSCFRTFFIQGLSWSYSLAHIVHHFRLEDMLVKYWKKRLGKRLLVIPYGNFVKEPKDWTKQLLAHCNLTEEPAVFKPHETDRVVETASSLQVRQPINRKGLGVAEPYKKHMKPFTEAYSLD